MFGEKDHCASNVEAGSERSLNKENPVEKMIGLSRKGIDFLRESKMGFEGFGLKPQELTLSYLCENNNNNPKLGFSLKGKEVIFSELSIQDEKWVERDFLNLSETKSSSSSKRQVRHEEDEEEVEENSSRDKKQKLGSTLNLSLALPDVSLSLTASNALQNVDPLIEPNRNESLGTAGAATAAETQSKNNNTKPTCSNDFTAASLSYSYSHPFSHNPSCSMTHNSTENYEYSVGRDDQIWCGGEGTNGSVHSRFRPIGDGIVALNNNNHGGGGSIMQGNRATNKDSCNNSVYKTTSSDNLSFFPSELPARPRLDAYSGDSRRRDSENLRGLESGDGEGDAKKLSRPGRILREIVSESIPVMAQIIQEVAEETLELTKEYLKNLIAMTEKRDELIGLQNRLQRRSDLTKEALLKCQREQLEILVAVKMGHGSFVSGKVRVPTNELVEIFLFMRCRNVNCKSILPVDDCDCKFCSGNKGFCSSCMCPVCMNFDCASNTCSWVGCDVCSHWCHAACGIQKNLIRPGPSLRGPSGTREMQFHCSGCNHASEMFGFVKDVFVCCAKDWGQETLIKELDCVGKIFKGSEDFKGRELHTKAEDLLSKLERKLMSSREACNAIIRFFNYADGMSDFPASGVYAKELMPTEATLRKDAVPMLPATSLTPKYAIYNMGSSSGRRDSQPNDLHRNDLKASLLDVLKLENEFQFGKLSKNDGFNSLESIVQIKEAEARMFQNKADEAQREAEGYRQMIRAKSDKLEEEYAEKLAKMCFHVSNSPPSAMDPPPPPQPPPPSATAATPTIYPDSVESSPRSRNTDSNFFDDPPLPLSSKLRLMCSYGGHIVPRPHDKSLCYVGGDTRIVVVDRHSTLSSLSSRLSNTLLNARPFILKYQLPSEDLDSLISVTTDEDLENMIDEYDRTNSNNGPKPSRLRLFLFPLKPESSQSIGPILENSAKSEDWFLNALNGAAAAAAAGLLNRGFSDSASVNCLLGLDYNDSSDGLNNESNSNNNSNADLVVVGGGRDGEGSNKGVVKQDVHSVPDSPMLETTSSFGSTSSSPSLANLPPIRVHVEDGGGVRDQKVVGIEDQLAQMTVGGGRVGQRQDEGFAALSSPPPMPVSIAVSSVPVGGQMVVGEYQNRVFSDDERSDHGVAVCYRKPPQPQPQPQTQMQTLTPQNQQRSGSGGGVAIDLPSPDSVSSDSSLNNATNRQKPVIYQDQIMQIPSGANRVAANPVDSKINAFSDQNTRVQIHQQVQDSGYVLQHQFDQQQQQQQQQQQPQQQQQFIHAGAHYIQHHPTGAVPMSAYYPVYPPQQQQQHNHQLQPHMDSQYPVYYVQTRQPQAYNLPVQQPSINESTNTIPSSRNQTPPNANMAPPSTFNPMRNTPIVKPELAAYRTATPGAPQLVQVPSSQHQQQYIGYSQVHHPSQSVAPVSTGTANYGYEFADPSQAQIYYAQPMAPAMPQYHTMMPDSSGQLSNDNMKQQIRSSQPM